MCMLAVSCSKIAKVMIWVSVASFVISLQSYNSTWRHGFNRPDHAPKRSADIGRHYHPMLYPQISGAQSAAHNDTWYAISAYVDMRPLAYGHNPSITLVAAGPLKQLKAGVTWFANLINVQTHTAVTYLQCQIPHYSLENEEVITHTTATVACTTENKWNIIKELTNEFGVCLLPSLDFTCTTSSVVPVGVPPRYPKYPYSWADRYLEPTAKLHTVAQELDAENEYHKGRGQIAMCVPGVRGDLYVESFTFFLDYYRRLGVDTVFLYMHQPGDSFVKLVNNITDQQASGFDAGRPRLIVLPWCIQVGATYGCSPAQPKIQSPGFWDVAGSNFGQQLSQQDCFYRAFGTYRWMIYVDLDEFILPRRADISSLHELVDLSLLGSSKHAPAEIRFRSAFYDNCLPPMSGNTSGTAISSKISWNISDIYRLPKPMWSSARISEIFGPRTRSKFMCDPFGCDVVEIHYGGEKFCSRDEYANTSAAWFSANDACETTIASPNDVVIHHARVNSGMIPSCERIDAQEIDWNMLLFSFERLGLGMRYEGIKT